LFLPSIGKTAMHQGIVQANHHGDPSRQGPFVKAGEIKKRLSACLAGWGQMQSPECGDDQAKSPPLRYRPVFVAIRI
jgi:hypothetical protein